MFLCLEIGMETKSKTLSFLIEREISGCQKSLPVRNNTSCMRHFKTFSNILLNYHLPQDLEYTVKKIDHKRD